VKQRNWDAAIGLQIIGRPFGEAIVLKVADAYQRHTGWYLEHPAISTDWNIA
jgi:Asp-tRNA(Asn)/Glu-tRNA(Gln) amidotransferase A subunit family amidase